MTSIRRISVGAPVRKLEQRGLRQGPVDRFFDANRPLRPRLMRSIIAGSLVLIACGSSATSGAGGGSEGAGGGTAGGNGNQGGSGGGSISDGGNYLRANVNGTPMEWTGTQVTVIGNGIIDDPFGIRSSQLTPELRQLSFSLHYRDAGMGRNFSCYNMVFNDGAYRQVAGSDGGCAVQFTNLARVGGDTWMGTFSGFLRGTPGYDAGDITITAGEFRALQP